METNADMLSQSWNLFSFKKPKLKFQVLRAFPLSQAFLSVIQVTPPVFNLLSLICWPTG